jgi:6-phosphogluconate dehydrogenase
MSQEYDIAVIGLGVMGRSIAVNIASRGFKVATFTRSEEKRQMMRDTATKHTQSDNIGVFADQSEMVNALKTPKRILLMVPAGNAVDIAIEKMADLLEKDDVIIEGGNSHYPDTIRRGLDLEAKGIRFVGTGISGGEAGALYGPCIMPGGQKDAYELVEPILTQIAAQTEDGSCCTYIGPGGAGHFVKMVHNGIEYGLMQIICEAYDIFKRVLGLNRQEIYEIFREWNEGELGGYLIEITRDIFQVKDEDGEALVEKILDTAGQKGTGKWTAQAGLDIGVSVPNLSAAVEGRILSAFKDERIAAAPILKTDAVTIDVDKDEMIKAVGDALYASLIVCYAQGLALMRQASIDYEYNLNFPEIGRIWKGGCIIRAKLLDVIMKAYRQQPDLANLMLDPTVTDVLKSRLDNWRKVVSTVTNIGVPILGLSTALQYFESYREERLPANLLQAQRDYFGAHTYKRIDKDGVYHTEWEALAKGE